MQAFCALEDLQAQHSAEPVTVPVSCQSIVQAMARSACPAADQRQGAALKRKASLVGLS